MPNLYPTPVPRHNKVVVRWDQAFAICFCVVPTRRFFLYRSTNSTRGHSKPASMTERLVIPHLLGFLSFKLLLPMILSKVKPSSFDRIQSIKVAKSFFFKIPRWWLRALGIYIYNGRDLFWLTVSSFCPQKGKKLYH